MRVRLPEGDAMATGTDIKVTITPEAQAKIDELGRRPEFERMLEHARRTIPGVTAIAVDAPWIHDLQDDSIVFLEIYVRDAEPKLDHLALEREYFRWQCAVFPPEVYAHFRAFIPAREAP
jgi:hypothetical protein